MDLALVTLEDFQPFLGQRFAVIDGAEDTALLSVALAAVEPLGGAPGPGGRAPFHLVFNGPLQRVLP